MFPISDSLLQTELLNFQIQTEALSSAEKIFSLVRFAEKLHRPLKVAEDSTSDPPSFLEFEELSKKTPE